MNEKEQITRLPAKSEGAWTVVQEANVRRVVSQAIPVAKTCNPPFEAVRELISNRPVQPPNRTHYID